MNNSSKRDRNISGRRYFLYLKYPLMSFSVFLILDDEFRYEYPFFGQLKVIMLCINLIAKKLPSKVVLSIGNQMIQHHFYKRSAI